MAVFSAVVLVAAFAVDAQVSRTFNVGSGARIEIVNPAGRVEARTVETPQTDGSIESAAATTGAVLITATSPSAVADKELKITATASLIQVKVEPAESKKRIDITLTVPAKVRFKIETKEGEVRIVGDLLSADVKTDTGTISAEVPTAELKYVLRWTASRPRYLSDFDLEKIKEKAAGKFEISGTFRDEPAVAAKDDPPAEEVAVDTAGESPPNGGNPNDPKPSKKNKKRSSNPVSLNLETARGIILINIPPNEVSSDLRERPLTNAAKAIIRSGDSLLMEAIRRAAPKYYGDYTRTLPPIKLEPKFADRPNIERVTVSSVKVASVRVSDINNRAIADLAAGDFEVYESGSPREIISVRPASAPFNLVLLLDVSGSVDNYVNFIRKAARNFVNTVDKRDRISIVTFNDDVKVISKFTTDKALLSESLDTFDAGGATAYYDALAYTLADTLRPLKGDRTAIVILTDGDDNRSFLPFDSTVSSIQESGALIYPLYVPSALVAAAEVEPAASMDTLRQRYLQGELTSKAKGEGQRLANVSGGVYYEINQLSQLQSAYEDIVRQLRTAYEIEYRSELGGIDAANSPRLKIRAKKPNTYVQVRSVERTAPK
ncbi:MAG: VWA domain-containing protein [Acidobacteria bacterium]|nr:VWA domain-containing protein [Acidobacteriota bacterium]